MNDVREDFERRTMVLQGVEADELQHRLRALISWMQQQPPINSVLIKLKNDVNVEELFAKQDCLPQRHRPPPAGSLEEISAVGLFVIEEIAKGGNILTIARNRSITGIGNSIDGVAQDVLSKYVNPLLGYVRDALPETYFSPDVNLPIADPPIVKESLEKFRGDHPDPKNVGFLMMKFGETPAHKNITEAVRSGLKKFGLIALRADEKEYHEDLFPNVQTYMHGCGFGIAVLERIEAEEFNPNVSLEVGYMLAQRKPVLLLKDSTLKQLHTDLVGKLYRSFDFQKPQDTIPPQLKSWLEDKGLI